MHCIFRTLSYAVLMGSRGWMVLPEDGDNERRKASVTQPNSVYWRQRTESWVNEVGIKLQSNMPNESLTVFTL